MIAHVMLVAGARPNFVKVAPLVRELGKWSRSFRNTLIHTGQHYDESMSAVFFDELGMAAPEVNLDVGSASHAAQTSAIMSRFEPVLLDRRPDMLLVVGDVNSALACALVAAKLGIEVGHVEAGLRSFDRTNRLVGTDTGVIVDGWRSVRDRRPVARVPDLWDGRAAERICRVLRDRFGAGDSA